ncbi:amino acid permease [bacterium]|nr:amino acid permease [bacterium]
MIKISPFWRGLFVFVGTIIGVGIFAMPWVASQAGFLSLIIYFLLLGALAITIHLIFAQVCLETKSLHRLPGYAELYLGKKWATLAYLSIFVGLFGAQLAYLLVGGDFLFQLLGPVFGGMPFLYVFIFFLVGSILIYKDIKSISLGEILINLSFFLLLLFLTYKALPKISFARFSVFRSQNIILPYGVVLFSLWGSAIVPEVKEIVNGDRKLLRRIIVSGIIIAILVYVLFSFVIVGVMGENTSREAFLGLDNYLGKNILKLGYLFGVITCFTSFLTLGLTLKKTLWYDLKLPHRISWAIAVVLPLLFYLVGFKNFIEIIGLSGAIAIGIEGIIDVSLYKKVLEEKHSCKMSKAFYLLSLFLILGAVLKIINHF